MVAARDFQLAEETVRELRAQGHQDRAAASEAVLVAAASAALVGGGESLSAAGR
jgi:hypothetical protein